MALSLFSVFTFYFLPMTVAHASQRSLHDIGVSPETMPPENCVCLEHLKTGLINNPVAIIHIDDDAFLLAEQPGRVYLYFDGDPNRKLVLDMTATSAFTGQLIDERGLLSVTIHPDFKNNHRFYIYYISGKTHEAIISEFVLSGKLPLDLSSGRRILAIQRQIDGRENGGQIFFGIDKMLYISVGSGSEEWENSAQNKSELTGKILRIDLDNVNIRARENNEFNEEYFQMRYSIPSDNPFRNKPEAREEIYALGVKNMWRCSIDRGNRQTGYGKGRIFCGDVGHDSYEEINIIKKGGNYGWNLREGFQYRRKDKDIQTSIDNEVLPIYVYKHDWTRKAVIGGYIYRGTRQPWLNGQYIFADFLSLELFRLQENANNNWKAAALPYCSPSQCEETQKRSHLMQYILSFGEDLKGELYLLVTTDLSGTKSTGGVFRLTSQIRNHSQRLFFTLSTFLGSGIVLNVVA